MKTTLLVALLALSVLANAVLLFQHRSPAAPATTAVAPAATVTPADPDPAAGSAASPAETARFVQTWTRLQTGDPKAFIAWLRAAGFPPKLIRTLVAAQLSEQYSARRAALLGEQKETPYWKNFDYGYRDPKIQTALRELSKEQSKLLTELLGANALSDNPEMKLFQRRQFGDLPQEKVEQVQRVLSDYNDLRNDIQIKARGILLPEDRQSIALIDKEQRADLAALLTPQELEDYDLRNSSTANQLRSQLSFFDPTEAEYRALFKLQQAIDAQGGTPGLSSMTGDLYRQRQQDLLAQAAAVLTPERYEAYKQAIEPAYQNASRLLARLDLPTTLAPQLVSTQQEVIKQASALQSDRTLTTEQRNAQLSALLESTTTRLSTLLGGTRGLEAYKAQGGGWLQMLQPRKTPTPPPGAGVTGAIRLPGG